MAELDELGDYIKRPVRTYSEVQGDPKVVLDEQVRAPQCPRRERLHAGEVRRPEVEAVRALSAAEPAQVVHEKAKRGGRPIQLRPVEALDQERPVHQIVIDRDQARLAGNARQAAEQLRPRAVVRAAPHELDEYPRVFDRDYEPMLPETRAALAATFAEPNRRLEELLGWSGVWHP